MQPDVGGHDRRDGRPAGELHPQGLPDDAAGPVCPGQERAAVGDGRAGRVLRRDLDSGPVLDQAGEQLAAGQPDADRQRPLGQQPLDLMLTGDQREREPGRQSGKVHRHRAEHADPVHQAPGGDQRVGEAAGIEQLQRPGMDDERPRQVRRPRVALQHQHIQARRGEIAGQQQAGRARPCDEDIRLPDGRWLPDGHWLPPAPVPRAPAELRPGACLAGLPSAPADKPHQGSCPNDPGPSAFHRNPHSTPVGPSAGSVARCTLTWAPSSADRNPLCLFRSVAQ
jgi:hypothetical protein